MTWKKGQSGNPGAVWKKGQSGNVGGRPRKLTLMKELGEFKAAKFAERLYELAFQNDDLRVAMEAVKEGLKRLYFMDENDPEMGPLAEALRRIIEVKFVGNRDAGAEPAGEGQTPPAKG